MRRLAVLVILLALLGFTGTAAAGIVTRTDDDGRTIRFDVLADGVDVDWHSALLRDATHGDEIERVTIRIVPRGELGERCGTPEAGACYTDFRGRPLIVIPAGESSEIAHSLLHEYGHHVDRSSGHGGLREPNGTRRWWLARGMGRLVELESVAGDYRIGWERSIGEIYAEDYAYVHLGGPHRIGWLDPPDETVQAALLADLGIGDSDVSAPAEPAVKPIVIVRSGVLGPGERQSLSFGLLGPGRRVTFTARVARARARLEVVCSNGRRFAKRLTSATATIDVRNLGPADCRASVRSTGSVAQGYRLRLRLSVPA